MPVPVSPSDGPGFSGRPSQFAGGAHDAAAGLRDHVEGEVLLVGAALAEALDLAVDDRRVERSDDVGAEAEPLDRAGGEILHQHVGLGGQVLDQLQALRVLQVDGDRLLVGVEIQEIRVIHAGLPPSERPGSPPLGFSTFTTSAPSQARVSVQDGPASNWVMSRTRTPARQSPPKLHWSS